MISGLMTIAKEEGPLALWKGLVPGLQRQLINASLRVGLYEPIRNFYGGGDSLLRKIAAGLTSGAIGIAFANPTDVVKVRLQAQTNAGAEAKYTGAMDCYKKIIAEDGIIGLWTGIGPNVMRNAIINAAELATYD
jgi:solute carrier family 25 uncoupling protein 8/9